MTRTKEQVRRQVFMESQSWLFSNALARNLEITNNRKKVSYEGEVLGRNKNVWFCRMIISFPSIKTKSQNPKNEMLINRQSFPIVYQQ
ncbi:hypothetical protein LINPERHAP2_LOCUS14562 [Linum perenne]